MLPLPDKDLNGEDINNLPNGNRLSTMLLSPTGIIDHNLLIRLLVIPLTHRFILSILIPNILTLLPRHMVILHLLALPPTSIL
ncbi:Peptidase C14 caspase catalytic [Penicillium fimorum]|uniref:Peptidase C14 caspase catalytic n=1 Tax=Penicillium fimorum TaxID=1882269 RepID=A0A9W9Y3E1_9EURO|nr:Peptidase C14 caspase catalytic [Penicillium fimorum]